MNAPEFLDLEDVLEIHALQRDEFGGIAGVRERGVLESAVEQPRALSRRAGDFDLAIPPWVVYDMRGCNQGKGTSSVVSLAARSCLRA
jgi:hypothetical protein